MLSLTEIIAKFGDARGDIQTAWQVNMSFYRHSWYIGDVIKLTYISASNAIRRRYGKSIAAQTGSEVQAMRIPDVHWAKYA